MLWRGSDLLNNILDDSIQIDKKILNEVFKIFKIDNNSKKISIPGIGRRFLQVSGNFVEIYVKSKNSIVFYKLQKRSNEYFNVIGTVLVSYSIPENITEVREMHKDRKVFKGKLFNVDTELVAMKLQGGK